MRKIKELEPIEVKICDFCGIEEPDTPSHYYVRTCPLCGKDVCSKCEYTVSKGMKAVNMCPDHFWDEVKSCFEEKDESTKTEP